MIHEKSGYNDKEVLTFVLECKTFNERIPIIVSAHAHLIP